MKCRPLTVISVWLGQVRQTSRSKDRGPWVDWARPAEGHVAKPSWLGRRYRATVAGPNVGATFAPDAQAETAAP